MRHASVRRIIMVTKYNLINYLSIPVINVFQMRLSVKCLCCCFLYKQYSHIYVAYNVICEKHIFFPEKNIKQDANMNIWGII